MLTPKSWIRESFAFLLGPACSATHFHAHAAAYNVLLYGLKRYTERVRVYVCVFVC